MRELTFQELIAEILEKENIVPKVKEKSKVKEETKSKKAKTSKRNGALKEGELAHEGSKRWFIIEAMKRGGTSEKIKERAVKLAAKKGKKFSAADFKSVDVSFIANMLKERGLEIEHEEDEYKLVVEEE
jgi:hypothetical protein